MPANQVPIPERLKLAGFFCMSIGIFGCAILVLALATVWSTGWGADLFAPGATLITVALTAYVAGRGIVSWKEQRQRDREVAEYRHREAVYEQIVTYMLFRFLQQPTNKALDGELRARAALWGSAEVVQALQHWQACLSQILNNHGMTGGGGVVSMNEEEQHLMKSAYGRALAAMRNDLGSSSGKSPLSEDVLLASIFND